MLESTKRFVLALGGRQSGKSCIGPPWMLDRIKQSGPGDYLVVSPSYPLMLKKVLPEFLRVFEKQLRLGEYRWQRREFLVNAKPFRSVWRDHGIADWDTEEQTKVFFGHAEDPESLESATAKAAWLDEAGQSRFKQASYEAILGRLSLHQGRVLITTTPYVTTGWLKRDLYDPWRSAKQNHPWIDVIQFKSIENPAFPVEEYERARQTLPPWKFRMFYEAEFSRAAGMIFDCFDPDFHIVPPFALPNDWERYLGLDFGGVHTCGVFLAEQPGTGRLYLYREYGPIGSRTAAEHTAELLRGEPMIPTCVGGSRSEGQWRQEFAAAGLPVRGPATSDNPDYRGADAASVETGIDRCYGAIKRNELFVFANCRYLIDQLQSYSREVDEAGEPLETIADKDTFHGADSLRYIISWLRRGGAKGEVSIPTIPQDRSVIERAPVGVVATGRIT